MNEKELKYYRAIGEITSGVSSAKTYDEALSIGLKTILSASMADYAVVWYYTEEKVLRPFYSVCPVDLTLKSHASGEGLVGEVFLSNTSKYADYKEEPDKTDGDFDGINVGSAYCLPFASQDSLLGCIEFIKADGGFSDEEKDACELLSMMTQMALNESAPSLNVPVEKPVLISAKDVTKTYLNGEEYTKVLKGVNFDVLEGEFLCFLGESGCGKSTMLNIIGGLLDADKGSSLKFKGQELIGLTQNELTKFRRDNLGFIFQAYNLMPNLTAKQNLQLIAELVKDPMDPDEALRLVKMEAKADNYPSQLSGGQQQRVSIARALIKKPKLILADEPTAALDYETSIEVLTVMEELVKSGATLIMVTHNEEITKMADRVIRFKDGKTYEITVNKHPVHATELVW